MSAAGHQQPSVKAQILPPERLLLRAKQSFVVQILKILDLNVRFHQDQTFVPSDSNGGFRPIAVIGTGVIGLAERLTIPAVYRTLVVLAACMTH